MNLDNSNHEKDPVILALKLKKFIFMTLAPGVHSTMQVRSTWSYNYTLDRLCVYTATTYSNQEWKQWNICIETQVLLQEIKDFDRSDIGRSTVNLFSYIEKKIESMISLWEIKNFERSKLEPSSVTCISSHTRSSLKKCLELPPGSF